MPSDSWAIQSTMSFLFLPTFLTLLVFVHLIFWGVIKFSPNSSSPHQLQRFPPDNALDILLLPSSWSSYFLNLWTSDLLRSRQGEVEIYNLGIALHQHPGDFLCSNPRSHVGPPSFLHFISTLFGLPLRCDGTHPTVAFWEKVECAWSLGLRILPRTKAFVYFPCLPLVWDSISGSPTWLPMLLRLDRQGSISPEMQAYPYEFPLSISFWPLRNSLSFCPT